MAKYDLNNSYKLQCAEDYFHRLKEKKAAIELKELRVPHSIDAHRLYWLWLNCIEKETGFDKNELHYLYRAIYLPKDEGHITSIICREFWDRLKSAIYSFVFVPGMNEVIDIISKSTSIYNNDDPQDNAEFSRYMSNIQSHARVHFNVILLNMKDKNFEDFYRNYGFV